MVIANPDLDSLSDFVVQPGGLLVASAISLTAVRAPTYVTGSANTYTVGSKIYISGAETLANNGTFEITAFTTTGFPSGFGRVTYKNSSGVTEANQFALCSPLSVSMVKGLTTPIAITAAKPFSYTFSSPTPWNPPPPYGSGQPNVAQYGSGGNWTDGTTTHFTTNVSGPTDALIITYPRHELNNLYPYGFSPALTLPVAMGAIGPDDGTNYLTFDGDGSSAYGGFVSKCNIFTEYVVNAPNGLVFDELNGVMYVADATQKVVRKIIVSTGVESIIAGGAISPIAYLTEYRAGFGTSAVIGPPLGLTLDQAGQRLYVSEQAYGVIWTINLATLEVTLEYDGDGADSATGLAIDVLNNILYIADRLTGRIAQRDLTTHTTTTLIASVTNPYALSLDATNHKLYYTSGNDVNVFSLNTLSSTTLWTGSSPCGLIYDAVAGVLYVSNTGTHSIYQIIPSPFSVRLIAGSGSVGNADGTGSAASFSGPLGLALDAARVNLYVADNGNNSVRRVSVFPGAVTFPVTTPAGFPGAFSGYVAASAALDNANSLLYISALVDNSILKYNISTGATTLVTAGCVYPYGLVLNSAGTHLYTASVDGVIYDVTTSSGAVSTLVGSSSPGFDQDTVGLQLSMSTTIPDGVPCNVSACSSDGVVLAVGGGGYISVSTNSGITWTSGTGLPGTGTWVGLKCSSDGSTMIAAIENGYVYTSTDTGATWAANVSPGLDGSPNSTWAGVAISASGTTMFVSDPPNTCIWRSTDTGASWSPLTGFNASTGGGQFAVRTSDAAVVAQLVCQEPGIVDSVSIGFPTGTPAVYGVSSSIQLNAIAVDGLATSIAVTEANGYIWLNTSSGAGAWVQQTSAGSREWTSISSWGVGKFVATSTTGIFAYGTEANEWINITGAPESFGMAPGGSFSSAALWFNMSGVKGVVTETAATVFAYLIVSGQSPLFYNPQWIARDSTDSYLYVTCNPSKKLRRITLSTNTATTVAYGLTEPRGVVIDGTNTYAYVADGNRILKITLASGATSVIAGSAAPGEDDGIGAAATFDGPTGLALDVTHDVLYVADITGNKIRKITLATADVVTIAGSGATDEIDGDGTGAAFNTPNGLALTTSGTTLYVTDYNAGTLRAVDLGAFGIVTTDVLSTIPEGTNAITINGTTRLYSSAPTIRYVAGSDAASYSIHYNGVPGLTFPAINQTSEFIYSVQAVLYLEILGGVTTPVLTFDYYAPLPITTLSHPVAEVPVIQDNGSSAELIPFIGPTDTSVSISSDNGFTYLPSPATLTYRLQLFSDTTGASLEDYSNTITILGITPIADPDFIVPFVTYTYVPISYTFSMPGDVVDTTFDFADSDSSILPYLSSSGGGTVVNFYTATGSFVPMTGRLRIRAYITGIPVNVGEFTADVTVLLSTLIATPPIPSGVPLNLYKYEAFTYQFTLTGVGTPLTLRYSRSSAQLAPYCTYPSGSGQSIVDFSGTPPASYSSTFLLVIDLMSGSTIVNSLTYPVTISAGRIIVTPASPFTLYQYEQVTDTFGYAPVFTKPPLSTITFDRLFSTPALPTGLSFSTTNTLTGKPFLKQALRNYEIYGSNSTTGDIMSTTLAIEVAAPVVRITPSAPEFINLTRASTLARTFTALLPATISYAGSNNFVYVWTALPDGLYYTDGPGNSLANQYTFRPTDGPSPNTIKLAGTPTLTDIATFPSSGIVTTTLTGYYLDASAQASGVSTLTFKFAEAVGMTGTASSQLYVGKPLAINDVVVTAQSYFPSTSGINSFVVSPLLPTGLSLASNSLNRWWLTGTPTTASTATDYTFTATNSNAVVSSNVLSITINPDIVTFSQTIVNPTPFIVSLPLASNTYRLFATATSGASITYTSSVDLSLYGLTLNSTTGYLTGIPTSNFGPGSVVFTATDSLGAFATYDNTAFTIANDVFTWPTYAPTFFQNRTITPFQLNVSTLSGRPILSFTSTNLPPGLTLSLSGLLFGTLTGATSGTFSVTASTGYQPPTSTATQTYSYTVIPDSLLIVQVNGVDTVGTIFSNVQYQTILYSRDAFVNPVYSVAYVSPATSPQPVLAITQTGLLSGDFTGVASFPAYTAAITATYAGVTSTRTIIFQSGTVFIPSGFLNFVNPPPAVTLYQYVPYTLPVQATGSLDFIYYFAEGVPIGFEFTLDPTGTTATLTGTPPTNGASATVTLYAKTALIPATRTTINLKTVIPYFGKPQSGAAAYTAILREHVEADAAHNAVNNVVHPSEDDLAGPFMAPRAPDVVTQSNCPAKVCKGPTEAPNVTQIQTVGYTRAPNRPSPNTGVVTTISSSGFYNPRGIAVRADGTLVVADSGNNRIQLVNPTTGVATTLAAGFNMPYSVAVLPSGTIVVTDTLNNRIQLVNPTTGAATTIGPYIVTPRGVAVLRDGITVAVSDSRRIGLLNTTTGAYSILAGSTSSGSVDGIGTAAKFGVPTNLAILPSGIIVVADANNNNIRLVDPTTAAVTTLAGSTLGLTGSTGYVDGTGTAAKFANPNGMAVLPNGTIVVADTNNARIRLVGTDGVVTTFAGGSTTGYVDGIGAAAKFSGPYGVAGLANGNIVVIELAGRIRRIDGTF